MMVYICFPGGKAKALTMSYDDGKHQDENLVEIFNRHGIKGTFNLNYGELGKTGYVSAESVPSIYMGHEVATHTLSHPTVARCPLTMVAEEILSDRKGLETLTRTLVRGHAYPNGSYNSEIKALLRQLGIAYGRGIHCVPDFSLPDDPMEWSPTCHHNDPNLMKLAERFVASKRYQVLTLMYVWGHSYEFDNDDNWNVIEEFCALVGGKEDIWYATNIEIIDYLEAAKNLQFSADYHSVYNPSAQSVWLHIWDENRYVEVKGGTIVKLEEKNGKTEL